MVAKRTNPPQITGHITVSERQAVLAYSRQLWLDPAGLLALLLARELRLSRLPGLKATYPDPKSGLDDKVTAHVRDPAEKERVRNHAEAAGMSISLVCATLLRAELAEQWLENAL